MKHLPETELKKLVDANVIDEDTASRIYQYYRAQQAPASANRLNIIFGVLGALLVSLGIILMIAHNWDELNKPLKTFFGFLPMLVGQVLCAYVLWAKKDSAALREVASIVLFFGVAASISLISQVYHVNGTMSGFLLSWLVLTLPLVYVLRSAVTAYLVIAVATCYAFNVAYDYGDRHVPWLYAVALLLLVPHYLQYLKTERHTNSFHVYNWVLVISVSLALSCFIQERSSYSTQMVYVAYFSLFTIFYAVGKSGWLASDKFLTNPFLKISVPAIIVMLVMWSFEFLWTDFFGRRITNHSITASLFFYITLALLIGCMSLLALRLTKSKTTDPVELSVYVFGIALLVGAGSIATGTLIINLWILAIGLWYIRKGNIEDHFGLLNFGLIIIAVLACARFFDDHIPFVWRGFFFLLAGAGFFVANRQLIKKRKQVA